MFSTSVFLFFFLPFVLVINFLLRRRTHRNIFLTVMSLLFYAWGEPTFVLVMLGSIVVNWLFGLALDRQKGDARRKKQIVALSVIFNLLLLGTFKYLMFVMTNLNWAFGLHLPVPKIVLPLGISFFTFQAMSYVIDVYRGDGDVQKKFLNVCLYISFFPQLIAGPIVRYQSIAAEIEGRRETLDDFAAGSRRFLVGLCKKVLLANNLALLADDAFKRLPHELSVAAAWLGAIAYILQVYYDFSGYSDMAIGLGLIFGFHFPENFTFPMVSKSITEFWRRWHISLGAWFRDYVFFPLGGSRVKTGRAIFNMFVVWSLTGLWHGADWTFLLWGISFFVLLVFEKYTPLGKFVQKHWVGHLYAMLAIATVTVLIRSTGIKDIGLTSIQQAGAYIGAMYGRTVSGLWDAAATLYVREYGVIVLLGVIVSLPVGPFIQKALRIPDAAFEVARGVGLAVLFAMSLTYIVMGGYNPFIYANF